MTHWEQTLEVQAAMGRPGNIHRMTVFAPDYLSVAITAHVCSLSLDTGPGRKFVIGLDWLRRIRENADTIAELDGEDPIE